MPIKELEHKVIEGMKAPEKPVDYFDTLEKGLILRLSKSGSKTFAYRYRFHGKNRRFKIGKFPGVTLGEARKRVRQLRVQVENGIDPQAEKEKRKEKPAKEFTFTELSDRFIKRHLPTLREKTRNEYERVISKELNPILGKYPAKEITRKQIIDLLDAIAIERNAPVLSNRVRAILSSVLSFGIDKAILETNPVLTVKRKKKMKNGEPVEKRRKRTYSPDEIKKIWKAFQVQPEPVRSIFMMLLVCGQRSGETRRMKWEHVDFDNCTWTIPAEETKAKRTHVVPLSDVALDVLENIKPRTGKSVYIFESPTRKGQPVKWLQKASERIQKLSEIDDFRIHDLRRTTATYMAEIGTDRTVLGKVLNHKELAGDDQVTAIYDRYEYFDKKREALQRWANYLQRILSDEPSKVFKIGS